MSSPITVDIPHQLGGAEARRRIDQGFARLAEQMTGQALAQVDRKWDGDRMAFSFRALGQVIGGNLTVMSDVVRIEVVLPGFLGAMAQAVRGRVETQGRLLLEKK